MKKIILFAATIACMASCQNTSKTEQTKNGEKLKSGEIAAIVICSFIFIVIICVVLFFTVFRKMKNKKPEEDTP